MPRRWTASLHDDPSLDDQLVLLGTSLSCGVLWSRRSTILQCPIRYCCPYLALAYCGIGREAACFALAWGALLRIGEVAIACRKDLILPADVNNSVKHLLLRIVDPKTRFRAARHQVADGTAWSDFGGPIRIGDLRKEERLWPFSSATLRQRFYEPFFKNLHGLPWKAGSRPKQLNLASLRAGVATWLISQSESSELVWRRGRWVSQRTMEIYIQEVIASTFMTDIDDDSRTKVLKAMDLFLEILSRAIKFHACRIPQPTWAFSFSASKW